MPLPAQHKPHCEIVGLHTLTNHVLTPLRVPLLQSSRAPSAMFQVGRGPTGVIKSVLDTTRTDGGRRDEIFVDIVEKLTAIFNSSGYLQSSQIDGAIVVRTCCVLPLVCAEGVLLRHAGLLCIQVAMEHRPGLSR